MLGDVEENGNGAQKDERVGSSKDGCAFRLKEERTNFTCLYVHVHVAQREGRKGGREGKRGEERGRGREGGREGGRER